ncbi:UDP-3-O-(3-hydroxymyristoyl)glucosamine N-acyltransferase [Aquirufa rosea]|uniref:UDP-3-O-acylglucosamine N-acyltransferase n=1 Tax=Aquirufa rosea TaxID=2509241 RepID=A0A4Q1C228_9BACT|nr:UDP-3-O-(3-hydroxymyristoyl)glucosamine N-acyltransferase [Aquirufa rosea]RXK52141.1 UDP-3-O-(3-hydroxymyristoyl)glucosamine N-acyltransferase [Aquirufa rosea]
MKFTVNQIAGLIHGTVDGNGADIISEFGKIEEGKSGAISFLANPKYEAFLYESKATAVIISNDLKLKKKPLATLIRVENPYLAFTILLQKYQEMIAYVETGIQEPSYIDPSATLGENIYIGTFTSVKQNAQIGSGTQIMNNVSIGKNVQIGENCVIYPGVIIYSDTKIGNHCTIHANAVIGSDGFGFAPQPDGTFTTIPQLGNVVIEDHVSIGANTTIDRATMGSTKIGKGSKIDNLVQIAHNVEIGQNTAIAAQVGISGSSKIGNHCLLGGQVGVAGHLIIADHTIVTAQSGVTKTVKTPGQTLGGTPASPNVDYLKRNALIRQLPDLFEKINQTMNLSN